jgi:hypothetical protein
MVVLSRDRRISDFMAISTLSVKLDIIAWQRQGNEKKRTSCLCKFRPFLAKPLPDRYHPHL